MLPKKFRLCRKDFLVAKSSGKTHRFPHFSIIIYPNSFQVSRFSIVTSSKLDKRSVVRNHLRRQIYNQLKNISGSHDVIIFPNRSMVNLTHAETSSALNSLLSKIS